MDRVERWQVDSEIRVTCVIALDEAFLATLREAMADDVASYDRHLVASQSVERHHAGWVLVIVVGIPMRPRSPAA